MFQNSMPVHGKIDSTAKLITPFFKNFVLAYNYYYVEQGLGLSANVEFYRWFFKKVFVRFVLNCRIHYSIDDSIPAYFCLDEESDQINPMREDDTICPVCCSTRHWATQL